MFTLLNELHFWTLRDEIVIRDTDFGSFRYYDKRASQDDGFVLGKKSYSEKRGVTWSPSNKRPVRLKDSIKEFEELADTVRVVRVQWDGPNLVQVVLGCGIVATLRVNPLSGDVIHIHLDRSLVGKLLSDYVSDAVVSRQYSIFTYADHQVTVTSRGKSSLRSSGSANTLRRWAGGGDLKIEVGELCGPSGRRLGRKLSFNTNNDKVLVWWKCGRDEVYPWSPVVRDQDRANVHIYTLNNLKLELLCFFRTESEPLHIAFSSLQPNLIHSIYQKVSEKGEVEAGWRRAEVKGDSSITPFQLVCSGECTIPLRVPACAVALSPKEDRILLACVDGTLLIADDNGISATTKASFIACCVSWHEDGCLVAASSERGQFQFYDAALSSVRAQLLSDDIVPSSVIDVGAYFKHQPTLLNMYWNKRGETPSNTPDCFLLLHFERGPFGVIRLIGGGHPGLGPDIMAAQYLSMGMIERAICLLTILSWETDGSTALAVLQSIIRYLTCKPLTYERELMLERALGCYYAPSKVFSEATDLEFGDPVHDLARKVFHHLLRYQSVEKAFQLAIDIGDYDLFMDLHYCCKTLNLKELSDAALERADDISEYTSTRSGSSASESSSSSCSSGSWTDSKKKESKTVVTSHSKPKVKFSNTVTRITLPAVEDIAMSSPEEPKYLTAENMSHDKRGRQMNEEDEHEITATEENSGRYEPSYIQKTITQESEKEIKEPEDNTEKKEGQFELTYPLQKGILSLPPENSDGDYELVGGERNDVAPSPTVAPSEESDSIKSYHENDSLLSAPQQPAQLKPNYHSSQSSPDFYPTDYYKILPNIGQVNSILPTSIKGTAYHSRDLASSSNESNFSLTKDDPSQQLISDRTNYKNQLNQDSSEENSSLPHTPNIPVTNGEIPFIRQNSPMQGPPTDSELKQMAMYQQTMRNNHAQANIYQNLSQNKYQYPAGYRIPPNPPPNTFGDVQGYNTNAVDHYDRSYQNSPNESGNFGSFMNGQPPNYVRNMAGMPSMHGAAFNGRGSPHMRGSSPQYQELRYIPTTYPPPPYYPPYESTAYATTYLRSYMPREGLYSRMHRAVPRAQPSPPAHHPVEGNYNVVGLPDPSSNAQSPTYSNHQIDPGGQPSPDNGSQGEEAAKIKVVHFGLV